MPSIGPAFGTGVNEHFKPFFNDGLATVVVMLRSHIGGFVKKFAFVMAVITAALTACDTSETERDATTQIGQSPNLESLDAQVSYLIGFSHVEQLKAQGVDIDIAAFTTGITAAFEGSKSAIGEEEAAVIFVEYQAQLAAENLARSEKAQAEFEKVAAENLARSEAFLAENAAREAVVTTESGLQYKVLEAAEGDKPTVSSTVQVHYEGRLISGEVFDSSMARGAPAEFALNRVIPGWIEGLQLMPEGAKYEFYIPADLAYGANGSASIGPNEALIFVVDLLQADFSADSE